MALRSRTLLAGVAIGLALSVGAACHPGDDALASVSQAASVPAPTGSVKFYVVQKSFQGQQEFLFEIAQRFLGDGNRFDEIFTLNEGRPQPAGGALVDPTSVLPGWILVLPDDAKGAGVQFGPLPAAARSAPGATTGTKTDAAAPPAPSASAEPGTRPDAPRTEPHSRAAHESRRGLPLIAWIAGALVALAAAASVALGFVRRRAAGRAAPTAVVRSDRSAAWTVDRALKLLLAAAAAEGIAFPGVYLVTADADSITVTLAAPSTRAPAGWTASADGRTWTAPLAALQAASAPAAGDGAVAALATLGTTGDGRVLLDFSQAGGAVAVDGAPAAVNDVVEAWLAELTGNPWSGAARVVRVAPDDARLGSVDGYLAEVEPGERGIAVFDEPPSRAQADALRALMATASGPSWVALVKGGWAGASWRFTARDGVLTSGFLPDIRYGVPNENAGQTAGHPNRRRTTWPI